MATGTKRPGSGRTKGSFSFVNISMCDLLAKRVDAATVAELKAKFPGLDAPVIVSRKWAEKEGFQGLTAKPAATTLGQIEGTTGATKVQATVTEFE